METIYSWPQAYNIWIRGEVTNDWPTCILCENLLSTLETSLLQLTSTLLAFAFPLSQRHPSLLARAEHQLPLSVHEDGFVTDISCGFLMSTILLNKAKLKSNRKTNIKYYFMKQMLTFKQTEDWLLQHSYQNVDTTETTYNLASFICDADM